MTQGRSHDSPVNLSPANWPPVTGDQQIYQSTVGATHASGMEFTTNRLNLGSEHSYRHEVQNPATNSKRVHYPWSRTSVICQIPVLSLSHWTTTGDWTTKKLHRLLFLGASLGGTSPEGNISLRRGGDIDHRLAPRLLGQHLQTLLKKCLKDPNILTRKEEEDRHLFLLLLHYLIISPMIMADTKEVDIVRWL